MNQFSKSYLLSSEGGSVLCRSIAGKEFDFAKKLIELGVDVNYTQNSGATALCHAAHCSPPNSVELINLLAEAGANINASDDVEGDGPLHRAAHWNIPQNAEALLRCGANVDAMSNYFTPLHLALFLSADDRAEIINILLRYNADTYVVNRGLKDSRRPDMGKDALQIASKYQQE